MIGVACIYVAAKFEEVCPLRLKTVYDEIAHKKIDKNKILERESHILNTLEFQIIKEDAFQIYRD